MVKPRGILAESAPVVVKLGGRSLEAPAAADELAADVRALASGGHPVILVHGGGAEVTEWSARLGLEPRFDRGLRVTDPATLEVVVAVLAGLANKRLVARLREAGLDAVGLSAADGIADCVLHPDAATLGEVGAVESVQSALLETLLARGAVPVLSSVGTDAGRLLNLNADDFAAALAPAVRAGTLLLLSDTPGLKLDGAIVPSLDTEGLDAALAHPDVAGGMGPKLRAARAAFEAGVARVAIAGWQGRGTLQKLLHGEAIATTITRASARETLHG